MSDLTDLAPTNDTDIDIAPTLAVCFRVGDDVTRCDLCDKNQEAKYQVFSDTIVTFTGWEGQDDILVNIGSTSIFHSAALWELLYEFSDNFSFNYGYLNKF